jgi:hypothetical protein
MASGSVGRGWLGIGGLLGKNMEKHTGIYWIYWDLLEMTGIMSGLLEEKL